MDYNILLIIYQILIYSTDWRSQINYPTCTLERVRYTWRHESFSYLQWTLSRIGWWFICSLFFYGKNITLFTCRWTSVPREQTNSRTYDHSYFTLTLVWRHWWCNQYKRVNSTIFHRDDYNRCGWEISLRWEDTITWHITTFRMAPTWAIYRPIHHASSRWQRIYALRVNQKKLWYGWWAADLEICGSKWKNPR